MGQPAGWMQKLKGQGAMRDIADYIVNFYSSVPLQFKLGNLPPNAFEQQPAIKQPVSVYEIT